jgi:guanylate kinase
MIAKRIILVGKSAAGKDHARKISENLVGAKYAVSYTTRPPRVGEVDGKDYYFLTEAEFKKMIDEDKWYEYVVFNDWYYGTTKDQFYGDCDLFIMTPKGLSHVSDEDRRESAVIYFDMPEESRRKRMLERQGNADNVERRIEADRIDFEDFDDYDFQIINPEYRVDDILEIWRRLAHTTFAYSL